MSDVNTRLYQAAAYYDQSIPPDVLTEYNTPHITNVDPSTGSAAGGDRVTIWGRNLSGVTNVTFNGAAATGLEDVESDVDVICVTPPGTAGKATVTVTTNHGTATSDTNASDGSDLFTYNGGSQAQAAPPRRRNSRTEPPPTETVAVEEEIIVEVEEPTEEA